MSSVIETLRKARAAGGNGGGSGEYDSCTLTMLYRTNIEGVLSSRLAGRSGDGKLSFVCLVENTEQEKLDRDDFAGSPALLAEYFRRTADGVFYVCTRDEKEPEGDWEVIVQVGHISAREGEDLWKDGGMGVIFGGSTVFWNPNDKLQGKAAGFLRASSRRVDRKSPRPQGQKPVQEGDEFQGPPQQSGKVPF